MPEPRAFNPSNPGFFGPIASVALRHGDTVYTSGLVGIDFTVSADVEPVERLLGLVQAHAGEHRTRVGA